jgi:hypothetical protein
LLLLVGKVCALFDSEDGTSELTELSEEFQEGRRALGFETECCALHSICSSEIYDNLFKEVRLMIRASTAKSKDEMGAEIQAQMDKEYNYAGKCLCILPARHCAYAFHGNRSCVK